VSIHACRSNAHPHSHFGHARRRRLVTAGAATLLLLLLLEQTKDADDDGRDATHRGKDHDERIVATLLLRAAGGHVDRGSDERLDRNDRGAEAIGGELRRQRRVSV
jgi:hypothetical protein